MSEVRKAVLEEQKCYCVTVIKRKKTRKITKIVMMPTKVTKKK